jgi:Rhodopirellula transposase DDE domain
MDCKATVEMRDSSRNGKSRTQTKASDHDMGNKAKYILCGILDEDSAALHITFGNSSKTSDFMVDNLQNWWNTLTKPEQNTIKLIQIKVDNSSENSGTRTQFLNRMVAFSDQIGTPLNGVVLPALSQQVQPH